MSARPWMPLYVPDYMADTGHLSTIEHGAYLLLLMHYWQHECLPLDDGALRRITRVPGRQWPAVREVLCSYFDTFGNTGWKNHRMEEELSKTRQKINQLKAAGVAGASARYGKGKPAAYQPNSDLHPHLQSTSLNGNSSEEKTIWVLRDDPRWASYAERWKAAKGKPAPSAPGLGGVGWHFPDDQVVDANKVITAKPGQPTTLVDKVPRPTFEELEIPQILRRA